VQALLERRIRQVGEGVAVAHGAGVEVTYTHEFAPTVNDAACVEIAGRAAARALGPDVVDTAAAPVMASEDFGLLAEQVPGCLVFLGNGTEPGAGGTPLHSSDYVFDDEILGAGVAYLRQVVLESLRTP
jgi:hippurate hydrolase